MGLAVVLAVMTMAVLAAVLWPLLRKARPAPERMAFDRAVYRDQLKELEHDIERGLLTSEQARTARLEIERRLLAAAGDGGTPATGSAGSPWLAAAIALLIAAGAAGVYLELGAPGVPDQPYAQRAAERALAQSGGAQGHADFAKSAAKLEAELKQHPDDGEKWLLLARTEAALEQWQKSADAYRRSMELGGGRPDLASAYGEMLVMAADGIVTPAARDAFKAAVARDAGDVPARFYLALADAQAGNTKAAMDAWQTLAAEAPEDTPLRAELQRRIAEAAKAAGIPVPPLAAPSKVASAAPAAPSDAPRGPSAQDMAAAQRMSPEERQAMIKGMVANLAQRLQGNPDDLEGWLRLGRAYTVLKEPEKAADAFDHADKLKPNDPTVLLDEVQALLSGSKIEDPIPQQVVDLLKRVLSLQPQQPTALWYLGMAAAQSHRPDEARGYWQQLQARLPADSDEHKMVSDALDALQRR